MKHISTAALNKNAPLTLNGWHRSYFVWKALDSLGEKISILEIGVGSGSMGIRIANKYDYTGIEIDDTSYEVAKARFQGCGLGLVEKGDLSAVKGKKFDLICAFEVLEHIENDSGALLEWREYLKPGGSILLSVPAFQRQFSAWDVKAGHYRRYERDGITGLLLESGYSVKRIWACGFPLINITEQIRNILAKRERRENTFEERTRESGRFIQPNALTGWIYQVASFPFVMTQRLFSNTDTGTGFVVFAKINK